MGSELDKGRRAEESLRSYFRELGYFVVRGVKIRVDGVDVTDVDLWLYNRVSPLTRERINVDIKNKKTPQALERVFWAKGVQAVLGLDRCIVATTDRRREITLFGQQHNVKVLDGAFLAKLAERPSAALLTDEALRAMSDKDRRSKAQASWFEMASDYSSNLALRLGYDGCNDLLRGVRFFVEQSLSYPIRQAEEYPFLYFLISYFLISLDFAFSETAFQSIEERKAVVEEGLRYGRAGKTETGRTFDLAVKLAGAVAPGASASRMRKILDEMVSEYPVDILAEHSSRPAVSNSLFTLAKDFNLLAFDTHLCQPAKLTNGLRSALFVFLDFLGIERRAFVGSASEDGLPPHSTTDDRDARDAQVGLFEEREVHGGKLDPGR